MFLSRAKIKHFKSLDDVEISFSPAITLIVGPNASGKTNIIDALRFVKEAVRDGLEHAISSRDGITRVRQHSKTKPFKVGIQLEFEREELGNGDKLNYSFTLQSKEAGNYGVESENGILGYIKPSMRDALKSEDLGPPDPYIRLHRTSNGKYSLPPIYPQSQAATDQLALGPTLGFISAFDAESVPSFLQGAQYHALYPNTLRELSAPDRDAQLNETGKNYASVVKQLKRTKFGRDALDRIYETMRQVVPSFKEVSISTIGGYLVPKFRFESDGSFVDYDAIQLSDGTLRVFGLLLALYQVPAPKLLLIEEPEQNIQPAVLAVLADAFREASERTQIVVTTHSPNFVDHFDAEEIRVTSLSNGLTKVAPINAAQRAAVQQRLLSLSEFMLAEGLEPEVEVS